MPHKFPTDYKCNKCDRHLGGTEVLEIIQVNCETTRYTLAGGHTVVREGLRIEIECNPVETLSLPKWVDKAKFQADFDRVAETIQAQVRSGRGQYRVYACYQVRPTETWRTETAKEYTDIVIESTRSLYHGPRRVKVGEVTL